MPIYEFRCLKCNEIFELLIMNTDGDVEAACPHCRSEEFERVLSTASYNIGFSKGASRGPNVQARQCGSGSCSTINLPGYSKD